jgi:hypothetical protein
MEKHSEHLKIYDVKLKKCMPFPLISVTLVILIHVSTDTHRNLPEIFRNRSAAGLRWFLLLP